MLLGQEGISQTCFRILFCPCYTLSMFLNVILGHRYNSNKPETSIFHSLSSCTFSKKYLAAMEHRQQFYNPTFLMKWRQWCHRIQYSIMIGTRKLARKQRRNVFGIRPYLSQPQLTSHAYTLSHLPPHTHSSLQLPTRQLVITIRTTPHSLIMCIKYSCLLCLLT